MNSVTMDKKELKSIVTKNRKKHDDAYKEAKEGYEKKITETLEKLLKKAKKKYVPYRIIRDAIHSVSEPSNHTAEYDRVLAMLEHEVEDKVKLSAEEYSQYIEDDWVWSREFRSTYSLNTGKSL